MLTPNFPQAELDTNLFGSALLGNIEEASDWIIRGANVNARFSNNVTLLMQVCYSGKFKLPVPPDAFSQLIALLVNNGLDLTAKDDCGNTVLHWAVFGDIDGVFAPLLKAGGNLEATNNEGNTPLHLACIRSKHNVIRALMAYGADRCVVNNAGMTPEKMIVREPGPYVNIIKEVSLHSALSIKEIYPQLKAAVNHNFNMLKEMLHYFLYRNDCRTEIAGPSRLPFEDDIEKCKTLLRLYRESDTQEPLSLELTPTQLHYLRGVAPAHLKLSQLCALQISKADWFNKVTGTARRIVMDREDDRFELSADTSRVRARDQASKGA